MLLSADTLNAIGAICDPPFFTVEQASIMLVKLSVVWGLGERRTVADVSKISEVVTLIGNVGVSPPLMVFMA